METPTIWNALRIGLFLSLAALAWAEDRENSSPAEEPEGFAMDTSVHVGASESPLQQTTTIFWGRKAYDVVRDEKLPRAACFDFERRVIHFIDREKKHFSSITFAAVADAQARFREKAVKRGGFVGFLADPTFQTQLDAVTPKFNLRSPWLEYEVHGHSGSGDMVERYVEFADWSARSAPSLMPLAPPASARLALNRAIQKQGWMVDRIIRTTGPKSKTKDLVSSRHKYRPKLSAEDKALIKGMEKDLESFDEIPFPQFQSSRISSQIAAKK